MAFTMVADGQQLTIAVEYHDLDRPSLVFKDGRIAGSVTPGPGTDLATCRSFAQKVRDAADEYLLAIEDIADAHRTRLRAV